LRHFLLAGNVDAEDKADEGGGVGGTDEGDGAAAVESLLFWEILILLLAGFDNDRLASSAGRTIGVTEPLIDDLDLESFAKT
jgi:hypothetical protein